MGYFDGYQVKSKSGVIVDGEKLQKELDSYGQLTANVTENKYGYNQEDVKNVAKLLHEANVRQLDVKTDIADSPLLYKKTTDASGNEITVKRGHFEKKKLLKDAREYEERMKTYIVAHPVVEEYNWSDNLDESIDDVPVSMLKEDVAEEQKQAPVEEKPVEKVVEKPKKLAKTENKYYNDTSKFIITDVEYPEMNLDIDKRIVLNRDDHEYLSHQKEKLTEVDTKALVNLNKATIKTLREDNPFLNIVDSIEDNVMIAVIKVVRKECFSPGSDLNVKAIEKSSFVNITKLNSDLESIHDGEKITCDADTLYDLSFKLKIAAGMFAVGKASKPGAYEDYKPMDYAKIMFYLSEKLKKRYYAEKDKG